MTKQRSLLRRLLSPAIRRGTGLARDDKGAVAIEFAMLAPIFFALVLGIIETSLTFFAQQVLESALQDSTRAIRTGQSQVAGGAWDTSRFRREICSRSFGFFACSATEASTDRLWVKVTPISNFSAATNQIQRPVSNSCSLTSTNPQNDCKWSLAEAFDDGTGSSVIIAQAYYKWPTLFNVPWFNFADQAGNNRLLSAVRVFKNEPF